MENKLYVIGNTAKVLNYNLNREYITRPKIVITSDKLSSFSENVNIGALFSKDFSEITEEEVASINELKFSNELQNQINEAIKQTSKTHLDVNIENMNFVSSISNSKLTLTLRTESFSITEYYIDKGEILSYIRKIITKYLKFKGNLSRDASMNRFHIEIFESEEINKIVILKKEKNMFSLTAAFGFPKSNLDVDILTNPEIYISKDQDFQLYENEQRFVWLREHNTIIRKDIKHISNILTKDDLKLINEKTHLINDVIIEVYFNHKNNFRINNISLPESHLSNFSDEGFYINKSSNVNSKISLITLKDNIDMEYPYPKYLLLENNIDIEYFFNNYEKYIVNNKMCFDGFVLCQNLYYLFWDYIAYTYDVDVIYSKKKLEKSNSVEIRDPLSFSCKVQNLNNPFENILPQKKEEDALMQKLKDINLNLNNNIPTQQNQQIKQEQNFAQDYLYNKNKQQYVAKNDIEEENIEGGAMGFFVNKAMKTSNQIENPNTNINNVPQNSNNIQNINAINSTSNNINTPQNNFNNLRNINSENANMNMNNQTYNQDQNQNQNIQPNNTNVGLDFGNAFNSNANINTGNQQAAMNNDIESLKKTIEQSFAKQEVIDNTIQEGTGLIEKESFNLEKYSNILAVDLLGIPDFTNVDKNFVAEQKDYDKESFILVSSKNEVMSKINLNYILPFVQDDEDIKHYYLINSLENYFNIKGTAKGYFVNISHIAKESLSSFIIHLNEKNRNIYLIMKKNEDSLLEEIIPYVKGVYPIDIQTERELMEFKNKLLKHEKRQLFEKCL